MIIINIIIFIMMIIIASTLCADAEEKEEGARNDFDGDPPFTPLVMVMVMHGTINRWG